MPVNRDLLDVAVQTASDPGWLHAHELDLCDTVEYSLKRLDGILPAIDCLLVVFPFILESERLRRWGKHIVFALKQAQGYYKADRGGRPDNEIDDMFIFQLRGSPDSLTKSVRRRRQRVHPTEMLESYIALLMTQVYQNSYPLTIDYCDMILRFARRVNDPFLTAKSYQTLAVILTRLGEYQQAQDAAIISQEYFRRHHEPIELAQSTYAIAKSSQGLEDLENARGWYESASAYFSTLGLSKQHEIAESDLAQLQMQPS